MSELLDRAGLRLGVCRRAGEAVSLDSQVVRVHVHQEEAIVTPVGAPGVATDPVLLAVASLAIADNRDGVVQLRDTDVLFIDVRAMVVIELFSGLDTTRNGSLLQLSLHLVSANNMPVLANVVTGVVDSEAVLNARFVRSRSWPSAIAADVNGAAESSDLVLRYVVHAGRVD